MVLVVKNLPANAGDIRDERSISGLGRSPGGRHGNPLQYSCLENPIDRGAWWAIVQRVVKSQTWLKQLSMYAHTLKRLPAGILEMSVQESLSFRCDIPGIWRPRGKICYLSMKNGWNWKQVKVAQLCPTLCNPMDYTVHGILQVSILQWVAVPFSRGSSQTRDWTHVSCIAGVFFTSSATKEAQKQETGPHAFWVSLELSNFL